MLRTSAGVSDTAGNGYAQESKRRDYRDGDDHPLLVMLKRESVFPWKIEQFRRVFVIIYGRDVRRIGVKS
jgi:hypothetical protein